MARVAFKPSAKRRLPPRRRDAKATRERLLVTALGEFASKGFNGARTAAIARHAGCNIRMIYHYFGSKDALYLAALERVYEELRRSEGELDLLHLDPAAGMAALVEFTFDYMNAHPEFIQMVGVENIQRGRFLKRSKKIPTDVAPLVGAIDDVLRRGRRDGMFRRGVDPVQLYISILSLSYVHVSNRYTLSTLFSQDMGDEDWLAARRRHVCQVILDYLRP